MTKAFSFLLTILCCSASAQDTLRIEDVYVVEDVNEYVAGVDSSTAVVVLYPNLYISELTRSFEDGKSVQIFHAGRDSVSTYHYFKDGSLQDLTIQTGYSEFHWGWYEKNGVLKDSIVRKVGQMYWIDYNEKGKMNFVLIDDSLATDHFQSQYYDQDYQIVSSYYKDSIVTRVWDMNQRLLMYRTQNGEGTHIWQLKTFGKKGKAVVDYQKNEADLGIFYSQNSTQRKWAKKHSPLLYLFEPDNGEQEEMELELQDLDPSGK